MFSGAGFTEESAKAIIATKLIWWHLSIRLYSMFQTIKFPTSVSNLDASLTDMNRYTLTLKRKIFFYKDLFLLPLLLLHIQLSFWIQNIELSLLFQRKLEYRRLIFTSFNNEQNVIQTNSVLMIYYLVKFFISSFSFCCFDYSSHFGPNCELFLPF